VSAFTDREPESVFQRDRSPERDLEVDVITRHDHLAALGQLHVTSDIGGPDVELRTVAVEERGVPATFLLGEDVDLGVEFRVRLHRAGLRDDLAALDVLALQASQEQADIVARLALVEELAEHLHARDDGLLRLSDPDDLDLFADLDRAALGPAGRDGAAALDAEDVLDRHEERLVLGAYGCWDVGVDRVHEVEDALELGRVVDRVERAKLGLAFQRQGLGDGRGERGLTVVDVTDRPHVHVRLGALELLLGHRSLSLLVEPTSGIEPETSSLPRTCSTN